MNNPFARGAGIAAIVLFVVSAVLLVVLNNPPESFDEYGYELASESAAILSWWCAFTFILGIVASTVWVLLEGIQWIAARIAPQAFVTPVAAPQGVGEDEASARLAAGRPDRHTVQD